MLAEAGAIRNTSAFADELEMAERLVRGRRVAGEGAARGSRSNSLVSTGAPVSAANDAAPTKRRLVGVCMTRTACPAAVARRTSSSAL